MAQLVVSAAGAVAGFMIAGPTGAQIGWALGSMAYSLANPTKVDGQRLSDLRVSGTDYGEAIPYVIGHPRVPGDFLWASQARPVGHTTSAGKGGGTQYTNYTYEADLLVRVAGNVTAGIVKIWWNGKLVWELGAGSNTSDYWRRMTVYTGADSQLPDPTYEAAVTNAPAYIGQTTVMFEGLNLGTSTTPPQLTFLVAASGVQVGDEVKLYCPFDQDFNDHSSYAIPASAHGEYAYILGALDSSIPTTGGNGSVSFNKITSTAITSTTQPWVVEWYVAWSSLSNITDNNMFWWYDTATSYIKLICAFYSDSGSVRVSSGSFSNYEIGAIPPNTRTHIALQFRGSENILDCFIGGSLVASVGLSSPISANQYIRIGPYTGGSPECSMRIDSLRICYRRLYTADFTPPDNLSEGTTYTLVESTVRNAVERLCGRAGMPSGSYDAAALSAITKPVRSLAITQVAATRSTLELLSSAFYFDVVPGWPLRFIPRGGASAVTIPWDDLGASDGDTPADRMVLKTGSELELPAQIDVTYADVDRDYNSATEHSDRLLTAQGSTKAITLALGMSSSEAKGVADTLVANSISTLLSTTLTVSRLYDQLQPADVCTAYDRAGNSYRFLIKRVTISGGTLALEVVGDDGADYHHAGIAAGSYEPATVVAPAGDTLLVAMDTPLLRDADDSPGYMLAAKGVTRPWPGGVAVASTNGGVDFAQVAQLTASSVIGVATTTLPTWAGGWTMDTAGTVTVDVGDGQLSSTTDDGLFASETINALWFSTGEIIRFRTATLVSAGVYTLSGLLRGQRGTEWAVGLHAADETVVLLNSSSLRRVSESAAQIGVGHVLKGVTTGRAISAAAAVALTPQAVCLRPLAPVHAALAVDYATHDLTISWMRRTRYASNLLGTAGIYTPLGEVSESYEVDIFNAGGTAVLRTLSAAASQVSYTAAQQLADFGGPVLTLSVRIYQLNAVVGRGYPLQATISTGLPA